MTQEITPAMIEAGREVAVRYCVRIEDFQMSALYLAMHSAHIPAGGEDVVERVAEALWQAESRRASGRERLVEWAEAGDAQETWRYMARAALTSSTDADHKCPVRAEGEMRS